MKMLTLIVYADVKQALADTLRGLSQVQGFTFTHAEGHGTQDDRDPTLSARDYVVGYVPHVRVDILLQDADVDDVLQSLRGASCGLAGRGSYQLTAVEKQGVL